GLCRGSIPPPARRWAATAPKCVETPRLGSRGTPGASPPCRLRTAGPVCKRLSPNTGQEDPIMDAYRRSRAAACVLLSLLAATACSDATGVEDRVDGNIRLSVQVPAPGAPGAAFASVVPVTDDAGRTLDIQQVQLVFEEIELESVRENGGGRNGENGENGGGASAMLWCWGDDDDDCPRHRDKQRGRKGRVFEAGPVLVDLPLDGGVISLLEGEVPPGSYRELELEIDRPNDRKPSHQAFRDEHPDWPRNASIRVRGTFDPGTGAQAFDVFLNLE